MVNLIVWEGCEVVAQFKLEDTTEASVLAGNPRLV